jgi:hypothetical protein
MTIVHFLKERGPSFLMHPCIAQSTHHACKQFQATKKTKVVTFDNDDGEAYYHTRV